MQVGRSHLSFSVYKSCPRKIISVKDKNKTKEINMVEGYERKRMVRKVWLGVRKKQDGYIRPTSSVVADNGEVPHTQLTRKGL